MARKQKTLTPRNGHTLVVCVCARISGCPKQKELSLEDQTDLCREVAESDYSGPVEYHIIATKGKGERLDRPELKRLENLLRTRTVDLLIAEDLGRIVRGPEAVRLCGIAVDQGTRVILINDGIDTADEAWYPDMLSATRDHAGHNVHTSQRLKQRLMNRFVRLGAATPRQIYGYVKPKGAQTFDDWRIDPKATEIYKEWFRRLLADPNCSAIADWLNAKGVPTGRYSRRKTWDGKMVRRITANPILIGRPERGRRHSVKKNETGRRESVKNPDGPKVYEAPHLAHVDEATFLKVNELLRRANAGRGRKPVDGHDPLANVSRKRTRFPGNCALCWYCGRKYLWGANGVACHLSCAGSREYRCWNSIGIDGPLTAVRLLDAITAEFERLDGFDVQLREMVARAARDGSDEDGRHWSELTAAEAGLAKEQENLLNMIALMGPRTMLAEKLADLERRQRDLAARRRQLELRRGELPRLPESVEALRQMFRDQTRDLAVNSFECADVLRQLVTGFHVYLVRCVNSNRLLPRARVTVRLAGVVPDAARVPEFDAWLTRTFTLDLFKPTQTVRILGDVVRLDAKGLDQHEIARRLLVTQTAVHNALKLARRMRELGLDSPYVLVTEVLDDVGKLRRHKHPRYRFAPLDGYQPPPV